VFHAQLFAINDAERGRGEFGVLDRVGEQIADAQSRRAHSLSEHFQRRHIRGDRGEFIDHLCGCDEVRKSAFVSERCLHQELNDELAIITHHNDDNTTIILAQ
jgi:hypothetical protein